MNGGVGGNDVVVLGVELLDVSQTSNTVSDVYIRADINLATRDHQQWVSDNYEYVLR